MEQVNRHLRHLGRRPCGTLVREGGQREQRLVVELRWRAADEKADGLEPSGGCVAAAFGNASKVALTILFWVCAKVSTAYESGA